MHPSLDSRTGERGLLLEPGPLLRGGGGEIPEGADDLIGLGEPVLFGLGEDERTVGHDVELATGADEHLGVDAERVLDRGRQTGGLRKIVSNFAVADRHLHALDPRPTAVKASQHGRGASGDHDPRHHDP